jgi:hypothetical protein
MRVGSKLSRASLYGALAIVLSACGGDTTPATKETDIDALRSLPYLGYSPDEAGEAQGVVLLDEDRSHPGFNLVSYRDLCKAELIDGSGRVIHTWEQTLCHHWSNAELLPMGDLLVPGMDPIEGVARENAEDSRESLGARYLLRLDFGGNLVWKARLPAHHDVSLTPRNQIITLTMSYRTLPTVHKRVEVQDNAIALLSLDGNLIEEVSLYDLFAADPESFPLQRVRPRTKRGHRDIDLFHANSVHWMNPKQLEGQHPLYDSSNILVSIRHQDAVVAVDWGDKKIVWMWGRGELMGPHDATLLDNGHVLVFDNGLGRRWSRIVEVDPISEKIVWEYQAPDPRDFYTASRGSNQRLPNGNTLITNSDKGEVFEVTSEGDVVWKYLSPHLSEEGHRATIVRSKRYATDFVEPLLSEKSTD